MLGSRALIVSWSLLFFACVVQAAVTAYTTATTLATSVPQYTAASIDQTVWQVPGAPTNQTPSVQVQLYDGGMEYMSLPVGGGFLGFSIELSIATTLLGENAGVLYPEFLNYCAILTQRGGSVTIRVGGNTQDTAILEINGNPNGKTIQKSKANYTSTTQTPDVNFTLDLFHAMKQISTLVPANWFFGIPFVALDVDGNAGLVMQNSMSILGNTLLGLQLANEPDLYQENGKKGIGYSIPDFFNDTETMIQKLPVTEAILLGPSICCLWNVSDVMGQGYLTSFAPALKYIDIMHYPNDNCQAGTVNAQNPQNVLPFYLNHNNVQNVISPYFPITAQAIGAGKQAVMLETNTASCGGFPGVSNGFSAALWGVDYGLQMAYGNFTFALFHFGGQNAYYNPFTPPPTNMTKYYQWTTGAIFYSQIVVAEALGTSGNARVFDLGLDSNNPNRAGYAVYENGAASRVVLVNYVSDPGASDYTAVIGIGGGQTGLPSVTPTTVRVKYLLADSVQELYNITWAGQTMGSVHESDGRLYGNLTIETVNCDPAAGTCTINVPAPSVALVFLTDAAFQNSGNDVSSPETFATTTTTGKQAKKPTLDPAVLATSNGRNGKVPFGSTSKQTMVSAGQARRSNVPSAIFVAIALSALFLPL